MTVRSHGRRRRLRGAGPRPTRGVEAPAVGVREIVAAAAKAGRRHAWRILVVSIVVSTISALVEIAADHLIDHTDLPLLVVGAVSSSGVSLLGAVFVSGFLCRLVGEAEHDQEDPTIRDVLRSLPGGPLIRADLLVTLLVAIGLLALVIPGLVALNLLAVVGPVIEIERRPARVALRRSAHLVRPHFWKVALIGTLPVIVATTVESALPDPAGAAEVALVIAARGIVGGVLESVIGLLLVELCYRLIAADRAPAPSGPAGERGPAQPAGLPDGTSRGGLCLMTSGDHPRGTLLLAQGGQVLVQDGQRGREPAARRLAGDQHRIVDRVHVDQFRHLTHAQPRGPEPVQLSLPGVGFRHGNAADQLRIRRAQAEQPEAAIRGGPEYRVGVT
jgi:uncharacterized membrane protein HdeD (DUF308 family)